MSAGKVDEASVEDERLQLALDAGQMGTWTYELSTGRQIWDRRQRALFGLGPEVEPTRETFLSMVVPEDRDRVALHQGDLRPGVRHTSQFRIRRADGEIRWLTAHSLTRADKAGQPLEVVGVNWDVTQQKQVEAKAERTAAHLRLALNAGRMGTWRYHLETGEQEWDEAHYALFGADSTVPATREAFIALVYPDDLDNIRFTEDDLRPGHFHDTEFRIVRPSDGQIRWMTARSFALHDATGKPTERIGVNWDITEQKLADLARQGIERRLELATEAAQIGLWDWDITSGAFYYSPIARQLYGFDADETITFERLQPRTHPDDFRQSVDPILKRALNPTIRGHEDYRYRITRADTGEERWLLAHGRALFSGPGADARPLSFTGTLQDITAVVHREQALLDQQTRLQLAIGAGELAVWELDVKTMTVTSSPELNRLYRFPLDATPSFEDLVGLYAPGERRRVEDESAAAVARGETALRFEARHVWPDGVVKWIGIRAELLVDGSGAPERVIGVAMDVTERRLNEERLQVTARELQHRVKNSLTIVHSIAAQSFRSARTKEEGIAAFNGRLRALAVATDLVTRGNWEQVSIGDVVEEAVRPYRDEQQDRFFLEGEALRIGNQHAVSLGMALHELCTNALKYGALSSESGRVGIGWSRQDGKARIEWRESGGPPVAKPGGSGFGTRLLKTGLFSNAGGGVDLDFRPDGVVCRIDIPL